MVNVLGEELTRLRPGIKGAERIVLALNILLQSQRIHGSAADWERGKSTSWQAFWMFVNVFNEKFVPYLIRFPKRAIALRSIDMTKEKCKLPEGVGVIDGSNF